MATFEKQRIEEKIKDKVVDWISLETNGRLIAFKPEKGSDLVIEKKGDYVGKKIFLQIKLLEGAPDIKTKLLENQHSLFVLFDRVEQKIDEENVWLIPAFPNKINKKIFINFLIEELVMKNKLKPKVGFKSKQY